MNNPNLDTMTWDDLDAFWRLAAHDPAGQAAKIFPSQPVGYVEATEQLALYAETRKTAMQKRAGGDVALADELDEQCDEIFVRLPTFARWR